MDSKKTIIFLHGWGVSSKIFGPLFYYFKNDFTVYSPDLPGFGETPIKNIMTLKDYADFVYKFVKDENIEKPIIIGHSFGGAVAAKFAINYPDTASLLVLVGASSIREPNLKTKLLGKAAGILKYFIPKKMRKTILKIFKLDASDYALIESPLLKETFKNLIKENLAAELPMIKIPALIIWGEKDAETPLKEGQKIAELIPSAKFAIIKNAGHFVFLQKPDEFTKLIREFCLEIKN
ncbi:alpha/beta hydrolase [Candidatus Azambacteria bacterium]|nr:alpha/beta hydrolase [Candidatus Azambacteria bacterium]